MTTTQKEDYYFIVIDLELTALNKPLLTILYNGKPKGPNSKLQNQTNLKIKEGRDRERTREREGAGREGGCHGSLRGERGERLGVQKK